MRDLRPAAARQWNRIASTVLLNRPESHRPLPRVRVGIGRAAPGGVLHIAVALIAVLCAAQLATNPAQWIVAVAGAVALAARPTPGLPQLYAALLGLGLLIGPAHPWSSRGFVLIFGVHLLVQTAALADDLPWSARVELGALAAAARRFLVIQACAQSAAVLCAWIADRQVDATWLSVAAGLAVAALAWAMLARLAPRT
jgi:hypothetical protein